jgi:predicted HicB family RNase H-like nuclease
MTRPRIYEGQRRTTAIRLPRPLHERLRDEAAARRVSANQLMERAIAEYLDQLPPVEIPRDEV